MHFGRAVATACSSFAITNIDDIFVLVTFFAEASKSGTTTPLMIILGQYIGFTVIILVSMIGFAASLALPSEPIGFLGLLPILLGIWKLIGLSIMPKEEGKEGPGGGGRGDAGESAAESPQIRHTGAGLKSVLKVSLITMMNGGDNIGTYVPLFSQAERAEIAVYVVVYYILLGVWCLIAFMILRERHVLRVAQRYARSVIPFLYLGLGVFIVVKSTCYPWSIKRIDESTNAHAGKAILAALTTFVFVACMGAMLWLRLRERAARLHTDKNSSSVEEHASPPEGEVDGPDTPSLHRPT
ncbi:Cadmium resistance transporter [Macrophomina phaseolina MS6]|uniref:Cadmium resistance transporter n=2 Tax=Macrophomina phaseolina TaxID=35725 RepID=K2S8K4_MACPH|nr:Cadmium resistance transporter [Macrophomina phaseolina MS6]KAH7058776.1 cadmium resistance transporter [Macrophomina phaseolina]